MPAKKLKYLTDSVYGFSDLPIRVLTTSGLLAMGLGVPVAGYTPVILAIVFFGGLNSFGLGVIGQYVWRAFENTKGRPLSLVQAQESFGGAGAPASHRPSL